MFVLDLTYIGHDINGVNFITVDERSDGFLFQKRREKFISERSSFRYWILKRGKV